MGDDAVSEPSDCPTAGHVAMQHDLEKLQEAHDKLLQELEDKNNFAHSLHSQLDSIIERNDCLSAQLLEKEHDLEKAVLLLKERECIEVKLQESEAKNAKLKQLAVKLKKELAEAKEEVSQSLHHNCIPNSSLFQSENKNQSDSNEVKEQLKSISKENERLSSLYQSSVRNFQVCSTRHWSQCVCLTLCPCRTCNQTSTNFRTSMKLLWIERRSWNKT